MNAFLLVLLGLPTFIWVNGAYLLLPAQIRGEVAAIYGLGPMQMLVCTAVVFLQLFALKWVFKNTISQHWQWFGVGSMLGYLALYGFALFKLESNASSLASFGGLVAYYVAGVILASAMFYVIEKWVKES